jgi:cytochrome c peroxidase
MRETQLTRSIVIRDWVPRDARLFPPVVLAVAFLACTHEAEKPQEFAWDLPKDHPLPLVPDENPMSDSKVELGRHLFYDVRLSQDESMSCSSCHHQEFAFSDGLPVPQGLKGDALPRNSMTLTNVAFRATLTWGNPLLKTLEEQTLVPLLGEFPEELGLSSHEQEVLDRLAGIPLYQALFPEAFGDAEVTLSRVVMALASFERTLISTDSPYDRFLAGDEKAINASARRGYALFFSERAECYHCHGGADFTNSHHTQDRPNSALAFHNTALYNTDGEGAYPAPNEGLIEFTGNPNDMGKYRVPTLRNVGVTGPYMHDGSLATLEEVVAHYNSGGRLIEEGPTAGNGAESPLKDSLVFPLNLTDEEQTDLVEFLKSLTDESFLENEKFSNPFE